MPIHPPDIRHQCLVILAGAGKLQAVSLTHSKAGRLDDAN